MHIEAMTDRSYREKERGHLSPPGGIPAVVLSNGVAMPALGYGVFQITDPAECRGCVYQALKTGYRLIDTAVAYGNERAVGEGVARAVAEGIVSREEVFVTTKVWLHDFGDGLTRRSVGNSMERLGIDYIDMVLLHQPFGDFRGAWSELEDMYSEGRIRAIGTSNFTEPKVKELLTAANIVPHVNQMEMHPFFSEDRFARRLIRKNIQPQAWGPLCEGQRGIFSNPVLTEIGQTHGKSPAQVALRWNLQMGNAVVTRSTKKDHMEEDADIFDFQLSPEEMTKIGRMDLGYSEIMDFRNPATERLLKKLKVEG